MGYYVSYMKNNISVYEHCDGTAATKRYHHDLIGWLRFHSLSTQRNEMLLAKDSGRRLDFTTTTTTSTRTKFLCADIIISCVLPGLLFVIVVVNGEIEATSRSSLCVQKRNENDSDIALSFSYSLS